MSVFPEPLSGATSGHSAVALGGRRFRSIDVCAGAGGLALGLEQAGFDPALLIDIREQPCETLRLNRPSWNVSCMDLLDFDPRDHQGLGDIDLLSAGLPRVQASAASNRSRGSSHEVELLMVTVKLAQSLRPRALLIDNVAELAVAGAYGGIRDQIHDELAQLGYRYKWFVLNAADFQVPQDRKHGFLVAFQGDLIDGFQVASSSRQSPPTIGEALLPSMASRGWPHAAEWARQADMVAPTVVGGSWERGGADLGPTGSKRAWARVGVDGGTVADEVPGPDFSWDPALGRSGMMALTTAQVARLQGFPADWLVAGRKTARYRQVANASPPPLAQAVGEAIVTALAST